MKTIINNLNEVVVVSGCNNGTNVNNEIHFLNDYYMKLVQLAQIPGSADNIANESSDVPILKEIFIDLHTNNKESLIAPDQIR
jgi:hypothetical protein